MKVTVKKTISLELTEQEAIWLREMVQVLSAPNESQRKLKIRETFWDGLNAALSGKES